MKKIFTLLFAILTVLSVFGQNPGLMADKSDIINLSNYPNTPLLVESGAEEFYWIGSSNLGTDVSHPMLSDVSGVSSNIYVIKYDKDVNPLGSAYITGASSSPRAFSFEGGLAVVGSASGSIVANGNTLAINSADRLEFIVKYNDLCQFDRMVSIWDLEPNAYPYSISMMDPKTGTLFIAGTASRALNLLNHGIIGKDMEDFFYVLSYDRNLALTGVFTAGMELGGEYGYYKGLQIIPDGTGSVVITGGWDGDRRPVIDDETLSSTMQSDGVFAVKLDKDLKKEWVLEGSLNGESFYAEGSIAKGLALNNGDLVMVGTTTTGHFSMGDVNINFEDAVDFSNTFVFRISSEGMVQWERPIQNMMDSYYGKKGAKSEEFTKTFDKDIIKWKEDVLYLCGEFSGDQFEVAGRTLENEFGTGAFVAALDMKTGEEQWGYSLSSTNIELCGFDQDGSGNPTLMGNIGSDQQFEGLETLNGESEMVFHLGLDFQGNPLWVNNASIDPPGYGTTGSDLEVLKNGEVYASLLKSVQDPLLVGGTTITSKDPYSTILVKLSANTRLGGIIFDKSGTIVYPGIVKAYKATAKGAHPVVDSVYINEAGEYLFSGLYPGKYMLRAIPDLRYNPDGMPTYAGGAISWDEAKILNVSSSENTTLLDITLSELPRLTASDGSGQISGNISYSDYFIAKSTMARPAKKTAVILKRKAASKGTNEDDIVAYLDTDDEGNFIFDFVPDGGYDMIVDVPGLPMNGNYDVDIIGNTIVSARDFRIETNGIYRSEQTGIVAMEMEELMIYPNPGNGILYLDLEKHGDYTVQVFSALGKLVDKRNFFSAEGVIDLDLRDLHSGMYLLKIEGEGFRSAVKYVKR